MLLNRFVESSESSTTYNTPKIDFGQRKTVDLVETINVNIKGTIMPWPLFSEKVNVEEAERRAILQSAKQSVSAPPAP